MGGSTRKPRPTLPTTADLQVQIDALRLEVEAIKKTPTMCVELGVLSQEGEPK